LQESGLKCRVREFGLKTSHNESHTHYHYDSRFSKFFFPEFRKA